MKYMFGTQSPGVRARVLSLEPSPLAVCFFDSFFSLPDDVWAPYLRVDTTPAEVARAMSGVFSRVPWPLRRRLATGSPAAFARLVR